MNELIETWKEAAEEHVTGIFSLIFWVFILILCFAIIIAASFFIPFLSIYTSSIIFGFEFKWIYVLAVWAGIRLVRQLSPTREYKISSDD